MSNKKTNKKEIIFIIIILIVQTLLYIYVGMQKSYLHIDEIYSYGLTHYKSIEITDNLDFFNNWHTKEYYEEYLILQDDDITNFASVYENQKNDVHPPLYYLLLRIFMMFAGNNFSKWTGIILNIIIYMFITIFMYLILKKLFENDKYSAQKSAILTFVSSAILASLSNVIYIRMYALSTFNILITTYLHIKLLESDEVRPKLLTFIGIFILAGILTHYYYLLYLVPLYIMVFVKYIKEKQFAKLFHYTLAIIFAGILSLIIFPYSIKHMFFEYRGQGVISNLESFGTILNNIKEQLYTLNYYGFNNTLLLILIIIVILNILKKRKIEIQQNKKEILKIIFVPSIIFFIIASAGSPWNVLRYIVPVCGSIFVVVIYYLYKLFQTFFNEKKTNIIMLILLFIILIVPIILDMEPELLYTEKKDIVQELEEEYNLPTIYFYDTSVGGFINDLLLFSKIDESYIAKNIDCTKENILEILENKDISNGIIIFISDGQNEDEILQIIIKTLNFEENALLEKLNNCSVYYIK